MARSAAKFTLNAEQQKLVTDNLNLARREAWRYQRKTDIDYKTLESVAFEGLCQAAYKYDPDMINERNGLPMKFSSIAVPYTRGAILHYIRDKTYLLRLSHKMRETWLKGRRLVFEGKSDIEIAEALGVELLDWLDCRVTCSGPPLELQEQGAPTVDPAIEELQGLERVSAIAAYNLGNTIRDTLVRQLELDMRWFRARLTPDLNRDGFVSQNGRFPPYAIVDGVVRLPGSLVVPLHGGQLEVGDMVYLGHAPSPLGVVTRTSGGDNNVEVQITTYMEDLDGA